MVQFPFSATEVPIEFIEKVNGTSLWIKRDDLIDPEVSGNKLYKLKHNLLKAIEQGQSSILTFGGAYSNHIAATAKLCGLMGLKSIGIIRGERMEPLNPTLKLAEQSGMLLHFVDRASYRQKDQPDFLESLELLFPKAFIVPEGGANELGMLGAQEILSTSTGRFDAIVVAVGTGTTAAGLLMANTPQKIYGVLIHKHDSIMEDVALKHPETKQHMDRLQLVDGFHRGGYAKWDDELLLFIQHFHRKHSIQLDPIYTGKAMFATYDLMQKGAFSSFSDVLFLHTGGLQGIAGFEQRIGQKLFPET